MSINERNTGPRTRKRRDLRNDGRALLRNRRVQVLLAAGTLVQGGVISHRLADNPVRETPAGMTVQARILPVAAVTLPRLENLALADVPTADRQVAENEKTARALAARYRSRGYTVSDRLALQIHAAAVKNGIDPAIAFGLVQTESAFKNAATSPVGALGLTQLMPATARWLRPGVTRSQLRNSEVNLSIGFRYLRDMIRKYDGDTTLALLAYNRGPGTVDRVLKRGGDPDNGYPDMVRGLRKPSH